MYYFHISKSKHCCAIYELQGLAPNVVDVGFIDKIKETAKATGDPKVLPLLIQFSDVAKGGKGDDLYNLLIKEGYKCDRFELGLNPKSNNYVNLYHWFTHKNKGISLVREYKYGGEDKPTDNDKPGTTPRTRVGIRSRRGGGLLRLGRRTRTGL